MDTVKIEIECPKGYEDFVIAYANEAIKIKIKEDISKSKEEASLAEAAVIMSKMSPAKLVVAKEDPVVDIKEQNKDNQYGIEDKQNK